MTMPAEVAANAEAKARWDTVAPLLAARGAVDQALLATYCLVWARWRQAESGLQRGLLVRGKRKDSVPQASPLAAVAAKASGQVERLEKRLSIAGLVTSASAEASARAAGAVTWVVDRQHLARLLGVHADTVTHFTRDGMPALHKGGRGRESQYDAAACVIWWREHRAQLNAKETAVTRAFTATAEEKELRVAKERRDLVPRADVVHAGQTYTRAWATEVRTLPRRLIERGLVAREHEAAVTAMCRDILVEISGWRTLAQATTVAERSA